MRNVFAHGTSSLVVAAVLAAVGCSGIELSPSPRHSIGVAQQAYAGNDGDYAVPAAGTVLNQYARPTTDLAANATTITLSDPVALDSADFGPLTTGDLLLVMQMQGATIATSDDVGYGAVTSLGSAGLYELVTVSSKSGATITLEAACGLRNAYAASSTQVVRVPQLANLTISSGRSIVAPSWNGMTGGVVALHVQGTTTIEGGASIDVSGRGFRGGSIAGDNQSEASGTFTVTYRSTVAAHGAEKGEGIAGFQVEYNALDGRYGRGAPANGGGGGDSHNAGGGGGANGDSGATWTGQGVMSGAVAGAAAWSLDPGYTANGNALTTSAGGGRGGYTYGSANRNALTEVPGNAVWGGNRRREVGGLGGRPVANAPTGASARLFMAGGGGAGDGNNGQAGGGGRGAGIVLLMSGSVSGAGSILANGAAGDSTQGGGNNDAPGGGGAGGTVVVDAAGALTGVAIQANGGAGGDQLTIGSESEGPGGGGGGGFIAVSTGAVTRMANGGSGGTTASTALTEFPTNGATAGADGQANATFVTGGLPACVPSSDLTIALTDSADPVDAGSSFSYTIVVNNPASNAVSALTVTQTLPPAVTFGAASGVGWSCSQAAGVVTCTRDALAASTSSDITVMVNAPGASASLSSTATVSSTTSDPAAANNSSTQTTTVAPVNAAPVNSVPGAQTTPEDTSVTFSSGNGNAVSIADADAAGNPVKVTLSVTNGALTLGTIGGLSFTEGDGVADPTMTFTGTLTSINAALSGLSFSPSPNFYGAATLTLTSDDQGNGGAPAKTDVDTIMINVTPVQDPPVGNPDTLTVSGITAATLNVLANDTDPDGDALTVTAVSTPGKGQVVLGSGGEVTYTANAGASGSDSFTYTVGDGHGNQVVVPVNVTIVVADAGSTDSDGDGIPDAVELAIGTNPNDADSDDDGVPDGQEPSFASDTDGDGLINALDPDSDNDGLFDGTEMGFGCGGPGTSVTRGRCVADADQGATKTDPLKKDTDNGGVTDGAEDVNRNGKVDPGETDPNLIADDASLVDTDGDGLSDALEKSMGTDPRDADSDDDGVPDGLEINPTDDTDGDGLVNALDPDSDNDGLFDGTELGRGCAGAGTDVTQKRCVPDADNGATTTSPVVRDTDKGGVSDGSEDANRNGRVDPGETDPNLAADDGTAVDTDGDGLTDAVELALGSNPNDPDSDDDGLLDGLEPNPSDDTDGDGKINILDPDSDGDGLFDGTESGKPCDPTKTDLSKKTCIPDADNGATTTRVLAPDTDRGGVKDGDEDTNRNGAIDPGERDPNAAADDLAAPSDAGVGPTDGGASSTASPTTTAGPAPSSAQTPMPPHDSGILEGGGCACDTAVGAGSPSSSVLLGLAVSTMIARRRRR